MDDAPERDDRALLAAHVAGDPDAFAELVRRHRQRLWAVAVRTLGDVDDAADALQDGLLAAFRGAAGYRGEAAVTTWLHRVVVNACLDFARRRSTRRSMPLADQDPPDPHPPTDPSDAALTVTAALRQLPADHAAAVVLVYLEQYSVAEAATILNLPEGTVKSRCARARARLAELLTDEGNPPGDGTVRFSATPGGDR